jgi:putative nucleotidyltransferase with HDIG domain
MALAAAKKQHVRVLVVDDDENILELYEKILAPHYLTSKAQASRPQGEPSVRDEERDLDVCLCHTPPEAIRTVQESRPDPFSLAFLDVHLGAHEETGIRLAEKIRKLDQDIEIVFVTGDAALDLSQIATDIPPKDKLFYLNKPFKALEIRQFTESLTTKWQTERQLREMRQNLERLVRERTRELSETNARLLTEIDEKEKAQKQRRQSEENCRTMIERNSDAMLVVDRNGTIRFANPAGEALYEAPQGKLVGRPFAQPLVTGTHHEVILKRTADRETVCEMDIVETEWEEADAYLAVLRDITDRKRLEENLLRSLDRTQNVIKGTIQLIARFLEMKDPYTAGHQKRVSELAFRIAEALGLNELEREGLLMASLIHDIGKISIPSEILSKPGKLSDIEYDLIKTHSQKGYDILKEIEFPWPIARIVLQHHERLDGSGYPAGVRGDNILLASRILTVADVMEAISSHRPYRAALGVEKGMEHIQQFSGIYYDPEVVRECVNLFQEENFEFKTPGLQARGYSDPGSYLRQ